MKKMIMVATALVMAFPIFSGSKLTGELKIAGGTAHIEIMKTAADILMKENPDLKVSISGGGSGLGIKQAGEGLIDIGNSGRVVKDSEIKEYGLVPYAIAIDGIVVVVNPESKVKNLTFAQIQDVFSGKITDWKDLGGEDGEINVYTRDKESGTRKTFEELALGKSGIKDDANFVTSNGNMKVLVAGDKAGIGYMSVGYMDDTVKALAVEGVEASLENIKAGKYKVQRFLYSVTKGEAAGNAKALIDLILSEKGQDIVKEKGFLKVK